MPNAVPYTPQPYVRSGQLGDLIRQRGRSAAEAELRAGEIQAQMYGNLGSIISGSLNQYAQQKRDEPIRAHEAKMRDLQLQNATDERDQRQQLGRQDAAFMGLFELFPDGNIPQKEVLSIYGPQRGSQVMQGMAALSELQTGAVKDARENAGRLAMGAKALSPALLEQFWPAIRTAAIKGGLGDEQAIPEQATPEYLDAVIGWASGQQPEQPEAFTLNPGDVRFDGKGNQIANVPAAERPEPNPTEAALALRAAQGDRQAQQALALIRDQRPTGADGAGWTLQTVTDPTTNATNMVRVNSRTGEVQPVALPDGAQPGGQRSPRLTAGQQDDLATMQTVVDLSAEAARVGEAIGWKGVGGLGMGSGAAFIAKNFGKGDPKEEELRNYLGNIQGTIAKLRGGTAFSAAEKAMLDSYTPGINDSDMVIKSKLASLGKFIDLKRANTLKFAGADAATTPQAATPAAKADPLGIR